MKSKHIAARILLVFISLFYLTPFYILVNLAIKRPNDFSSKWQFPTYLLLSNFKDAWQQANLINVFRNNLIIICFALLLIVILGSLAAYPLARFKTKLNKIIYAQIIACTIVPAITILVPLYEIMMKIHGINEYWGVIILHLTFNLPLVVFLYTGFIGMIPRELDDAALIDGLSRFGVLFRIIMPLLIPITSAVLIICGINIWNDYQFSLFFLQYPQLYTTTVELSMFFSEYQNEVNLVAAGCLTVALPLLILFLSLQKYFVKGLASGALKL